ncbi:MAG: hypothetical protein BWY72_00438 [Bacteroidetes bacterium ADurb.Bin416]|nr:MAG: hypothetical protein BWY72_00438 [Bacteroidetes bacterium ADurb.Bin416]
MNCVHTALLNVLRVTCLVSMLLVTTSLSAIEPTSNQNAIITYSPNAPTTDATTLPVSQSCPVVSYFDGLGRPTQTVAVGVTPSGKDLITHTEFDACGRPYKTWSPFAVDNNAGAYFEPGASGSNLQVAATAFYDGRNGLPNEDNPFGFQVYEPSPLNRVVEEYGPGKNWHDNGRSVKHAWYANDQTDSLIVAYYYVDEDKNLCKNGTYANSTVYVDALKDEDNNPSWVFTDKRGRTLLKRTYNSVGGTQAIGYYSTYYVYDDLDRLIYVLPPMAADLLRRNDSWNTSNMEQLSHYGYYYEYDDRGNCIKKKLPGVEPVYMVYDKADRLVLTQDGNNRTKGRWLFTKYDVHGRPIIQGSVLLNGQIDDLVNTYQSLLVTESYVGGASNYGYTNTFFQTVEKYMKVLYYDSYAFITGLGLNSYKASGMSWNSSLALDPCYSNTNAKGLQTGDVSFLLDNQDYKSFNAFYYDNMGRLVQKVGTNFFNPSSNYNFGMDNYAYDYDFKGNLLHSRHRHRGSLAGTIFVEGSKHDYDHAGRVLTNKHYVTNESSMVTTSTVSYNELGQLTGKARSRGYESQLFQYNIRGWLTRLGCEVFNEDLYYEKTSNGGQGCYNGNISQSRMEWMVGDLASDNWYMTEEYDYRSLLFNHTYDQLSRLTNTTSTDGFSKFGEAMTYDKHGNIRTINRGGIYQHGWNYVYPNHTYGVIDNVTLSYNGNQLDNVIDFASDPLYTGSQDFKDRTIIDPEPEYHFDANGNLLDDYNKGIVTIRSNFLNLPDTVQMENGDMASFSYSPSGDKFMSIYRTANTSTVTMPLGSTLSNGRPAGITVAQTLFMLYMDNVVYEGNPWSTTLHNLSKVLTDDGILVRTNSVTQATPVFERNYYIRDHLGNVRVVFDSQGRVRQLNNYTPFGMEYGESAGDQASVGYQDYKFGGKELDRRYELNWYNFGARSYDLALGRWTSVDPLAEKYYSVSPYVYCSNNPVNCIDPEGRAEFWLNGKVVGNDGVNDQKIYAIKTTEKDFNGVPGAGLSIKDRNATVSFIKENSGNAEAFKNNSVAYTNSVGIESSSYNRQEMVDIVSQDNGKGGTSEANNKEYGGFIDNGIVVESTPGDAVNPKIDATANISLPSGKSTFHDHPSGTVVDAPPSGSYGGTTTTYSFTQSPSTKDVDEAGTNTHYVFGRGDGKVYIYTSGGVQAIIPMKRFVTPKK